MDLSKLFRRSAPAPGRRAPGKHRLTGEAARLRPDVNRLAPSRVITPPTQVVGDFSGVPRRERRARRS